MLGETQVLLFGSLRQLHDKKKRQRLSVDLTAPSPLGGVLDLLRIPREVVQLVMVNHRAVPFDHLINPGDRVSLFPKEYVIFADWKDFRS
jgi:molybdopterin converting factor small subunit